MISSLDTSSYSTAYSGFGSFSSVKDRGAVNSANDKNAAAEKTANPADSQNEAVEKTANPADAQKYQNLSKEEIKEVKELESRDKEVRTHEQAHLSAAGSLSLGRASFEYQTGPDNRRYAVGGEVSIDVSKVADDPQATILKAQQIRRAALAPAEPSSTDRQVAADAVKMEAEARQELATEKQNNTSDQQNGLKNSPTALYQQVGSYNQQAENSSLDYFV